MLCSRRSRAPHVLHQLRCSGRLLSCENSNRTLAEPQRNVGDFDCSGEDIERDWVERTDCWSSVTRVLLTYDQVLAYGLPPTKGKLGDPRWLAFAAKYGFDPAHPVRREVEALDRDELYDLLMAAVEPYIDRDVLAEVLADEQRQREQLEDFVSRWPQLPPTSP
jgi:hypothetical protein